MASAVYVLSTITSGLCAALLLRMYRRTGMRMLFWCTLSFAGWTIANALVFADLVVLSDVDLSLVRTLAGAGSALLLLFGLVWHGQ